MEISLNESKRKLAKYRKSSEQDLKQCVKMLDTDQKIKQFLIVNSSNSSDETVLEWLNGTIEIIDDEIDRLKSTIEVHKHACETVDFIFNKIDDGLDDTLLNAVISVMAEPNECSEELDGLVNKESSDTFTEIC